MFRSIILSACLAGLSAGTVMTIVQQPTVAPLILAAERYESAAASKSPPILAAMPGSHQRGDLHQQAHSSIDAAGHLHGSKAAAERAHAHDNDAWAPRDGIERTFWTLMTNVSVAIGFALLLCAVYTLLPNVTAGRGVLWGLAGFVVFFANPAIGLHPEIPGTLSADLFDRQLWWTFTAAFSAASVALIAWRRAVWAWAGSAALLVLPHLVGAPQPEQYGAVAPAWIAQEFIWATIFVNAVFWLALGVISASLFRRFAAR